MFHIDMNQGGLYSLAGAGSGGPQEASPAVMTDSWPPRAKVRQEGSSCGACTMLVKEKALPLPSSPWVEVGPDDSCM